MGQHAKAQRLLKPGNGTWRLGTQETAADFEQPDPFGLTLSVAHQRADQAADQCRAHGAHLRGNWIGQRNR